MAATERDWVARGVALLACGLIGCAAAGPGDEGLYIEDAGAPFGFQQSGDAITGSGGGANGTGGTSNGATSSGGQAGGDNGSQAGTVPGQRSCTNASAFQSLVVPRFMKDCVRCHDGTKGKATKLLDLTSLRSGGSQAACDATLTTTDPGNLVQSTIFTFLDPGNPATVHDFKYATPGEFAAYQSDVLGWLETE